MLKFLLIICISSVISLKSSTLDYREIIAENERLEEIQIRNDKFCKYPPVLCNCTKDHGSVDPFYTLSCSNDHSAKALIKIKQNFDNQVYFACENVISFELIPDLTFYIPSSEIILENCFVPKNEILNQLTSKISNNMTHLELHFTHNQNESLEFNKNYFEGFSNLESLSINIRNIITQVIISRNVFENLVNLKVLRLFHVPLQNVIFDVLNNLQNLTIETDMNIELKVSDFKNQINLRKLEMSCENQCSFDPLIIANLSNLVELYIKGDFNQSWPKTVFKHNQKLTRIELRNIRDVTRKLFAQNVNLRYIVIFDTDLESLPEDIFYNSSNIEEINLTYNQLKELPKYVFVDQTLLSQLDLQHNKLEVLIDGVFDSTENMITLSLSHNMLTSISRYVIIN